MRGFLFAALTMPMLAGCTMDDGMAEAGVPLPVCPAETRGWNAFINAMPGPGSTPTLIVTGQALVPDGAAAVLVAGPTDRMMPPGQRATLSLSPAPDAAGGWVDVRMEIKPALPEYRAVMIACDGEPVAEIAEIETAV
ncbi:hypothetical protein [Croceicoccus mobilis]|nr:hypothetical protein [Croceicoccus mobilis]